MLSLISALPAWLPALIGSSLRTNCTKSVTELPFSDKVIIFGLCVLTAAIVISVVMCAAHWTLRLEKIAVALMRVWFGYIAFAVIWVIVRVVFFWM